LFWDTALKDKEQNDTTAVVVFELLPDYRIFTRYVWSGRLQFPQLSSTIEDEGARWMFDDKLRDIVIEDKASGKQRLNGSALV
jgi:phage terminase large subunit-like protein